MVWIKAAVRTPEGGAPRMDNIEKACAYMLHNIHGVGNKTLMRLCEEFGSAEKIYRASEKDIEPLLSKKQLRSFLNLRESWDLGREITELGFRGINFCTVTQDDYPDKLKKIPDPPFGLYFIGRLPDEQKPSVSIIGARTSSEYGKSAAREFGMGLAECGIQIISGMARGIDGIGQMAALNAGGESFAVLGSGVDVCYPPENEKLYGMLKTNGGIISEYNPGTQPKPILFPPRNRIISGLSDVVLVIEARKKSGTLITVDMALEQGREVFAVPGRIYDGLSSGCNSLIKQGSGIATSPDDIAHYLRRQIPGGKSDNHDEGVIMTDYSLDFIQKAVYEVLDMYPQSINDIYEKVAKKLTNAGTSEVMNALVELSIQGIAGQNGGSFYKKR